MRSKYIDGRDADWFELPRHSPMKLACCDCGLVHLVYTESSGPVMVRFVRRNQATAARRREMRKRGELLTR